MNLEQTDKKYIWHPFTQMQDWEKDNITIIKKAKGNYLYDINNKKYLDGVSSLWVTIHGHNHPYINKAINKQLKKLDHSTLLGLANEPSITLAEKLISIAPGNLKRVFYSDSGSTAMEIALKIAYQYWQQDKSKKYHAKQKFLTLKDAYHGDTIGSVSAGGIDLFHSIYKPLLFKTIQIKSPYHHSKSKTNLKEALINLEATLKKHHKQLAAFVIEPTVQGAAGIHIMPKGYLKGARKLCTKYNVLLICDEVAVGFGRTGKMFACEHENVTPDILALAKGISGGYLPLAATLTTEKIYKNFKGKYAETRTFFHGHTYTGNPIACSAAIANIELFEREKTLQKLPDKIVYLSELLAKFKTISQVTDIRQVGLIAAIELENYTWEEQIGHKICKKAREKGLIIRPLGNNIVIMPPLSITKRELKFIITTISQAINDIIG